MQPAQPDLSETPATIGTSHPAKVVKLDEDDEDDEDALIHPIVDLVQGIVYWSILAIGVVVPPIGALYTALKG